MAEEIARCPCGCGAPMQTTPRHLACRDCNGIGWLYSVSRESAGTTATMETRTRLTCQRCAGTGLR